MNKGKALETELTKTLQHYKNKLKDNFVFRRIPDAKDYAINRCDNCGSYKKSKLILPKNPADFVFTYKGKTTYIEAKSSMSNRYQLTWIKDHQVTDLIEHKKAGCNGYFFICYRASLANKKNRNKLFEKNRAWIINPEHIFKLKSGGTTSLSWNEISDLGTEIKREKAVWIIDKLLN